MATIRSTVMSLFAFLLCLYAAASPRALADAIVEPRLALEQSLPGEASESSSAQQQVLRNRASATKEAATMQSLGADEERKNAAFEDMRCRDIIEETLQLTEGRWKARHEQAYSDLREEQAKLLDAMLRLESQVAATGNGQELVSQERPEEERRRLQTRSATALAVSNLQKRVRALERRFNAMETRMLASISALEDSLSLLEDHVDSLASLLGGGSAQYHCGCPSCTDAVWATVAPAGAAPTFTCGNRINYMKSGGMPELEACRFVADSEQECAACHCGASPPSPAGTVPRARTPAPTLPPHTPPLTPNSTLYCFPQYSQRQRWTNVFNQDFIVETKEGFCGPGGSGGNLFSRGTISLQGNNQLKLQYKKIDNAWHASEVRIVLPQNLMPYSYGTYKFSVKSVSTIDNATGTVISSTFSPDLVLGMFTWDTTDKWDVHENWNHEVDIEVSRWGIAGNADGQFVAQPPAAPHYHRFFTGPGNTSNPGGKTYEFTWNPTNITWKSSSGQAHAYTTEMAVAANLVDNIQCLPADVEVRINLWNMNGAVAPSGMADNHFVEVVIDGFSYTPSDVQGVANGQACSKHCQCLGTSRCVNGICAAA